MVGVDKSYLIRPTGGVGPGTGTDQDNTIIDQLVREAAQGHIQAVMQLLKTHPDKVYIL